MTSILFENGRFSDSAANNGSATGKAINAIYVENGRIRSVENSAELKLQLSGRDYETVDWNGAYVLSGLTDSHMHLGMYGMKLSMLDFTGVSSKEEMLRLVRGRVEQTPAGQWILGLNWNENAFAGKQAPDIAELDSLTDRHPVFLTRTCFHAFLANTEAFRRAGIPDGAPDPESGAFGRDESGRFNGWVYENACLPFNAVQPEPDYETKKAAIRRACLSALQFGLIGAHTEDIRFLGSVETMLKIHKELREEGLFFRSHQLIFHEFLEEAQRLGISAGPIDEWMQIGAVKIFSDGAIGGRTALLKEPYSDAPETRGMAIQSQEHLNRIVANARRLGYPVAVHAIGDGAADMTLTAMETHALQSPSGLPDRLIHAQVLNRPLVERMSKLPLIADIQPRFVASDFPWVLERVGSRRQEYLYAWNKLLKAGIMCAGGSDAPIEPLDPFLGIHAAVTRHSPEESHKGHGGYLPQEKLSIQTAVQLFTKGSAHAAAEADMRGSIGIGNAADFTVIDRDITRDPAELLKVKVLMTVVNGKVAYNAE